MELGSEFCEWQRYRYAEHVDRDEEDEELSVVIEEGLNGLI
jgi:hypothetical protein